MGGYKRMMEDAEAKRAAAIEIAIEAGALKRCEYHDDVYEGSRDFEAAYRLGNTKFSRGEAGAFENRREMTDYIKEVIEDHPAEECPSCEHIRDS
jgi:hypothetical protein